MIRSARTIVCVVTVSMLGLASSVQAERYVEYRGGYFEPWRGDGGYSLALQFGQSLENERSYWGVEAEVRSFDGKLFDSGSTSKVVAIQARGIYRFDVVEDEETIVIPYIDTRVIPYVGVGAGIAVNAIQANTIERELEEDGDSAKISDIGWGLGVIGIVGVEYKFSFWERLSLFTEGRIGYSVQLSRKKINGSKKKVEAENLGGITAQTGLRFSF